MSERQCLDQHRNWMRLETVGRERTYVCENVARERFEWVRHARAKARDLVWSESHCSCLPSQTFYLWSEQRWLRLNAHGSTSDGADSVFAGTLRMGLCALFVVAVLLLILPRSSRAIGPANTGADFFCVCRPSVGAVCTLGGITEILSTSSNGGADI